MKGLAFIRFFKVWHMTIQFWLNDKLIQVTANPSSTLVDQIRSRFKTGTKIGCREGDCGACTVIVGTHSNNEVDYKSMTSCLLPSRNIHKKIVLTIEGIPHSNNIIIEKMEELNGTQCGFCTPGFVMSMTYGLIDMIQSKDKNKKLIDYIDGNICRCTGYKSIERAIQEVEESIFKNKSCNSLSDLVKECILPEYILTVSSRLESIPQLKSKDNHLQYIANGTDFVVRNPHGSDLDIGFIEDLGLSRQIQEKQDRIVIGAGVTCTHFMEHKIIKKYFPLLLPKLRLISSTQIRNMGTIVGNFVNASPIGDLSNLFLTLNTEMLISDTNNNTRIVELKKFFLDYKKIDLHPGEFITEISIPKPEGKYFYNFQKVSKRKILDIATITSSIFVKIENDKLKEVNLSLGGIAPVPKLLELSTRKVLNQKLSVENIKQMILLMHQEISPISDIRGDKEYKIKLAENIIISHFLEMFPTRFTMKDFL